MDERYPEGTKRLSYRWFDVHADEPLKQGPVIQLTVYLTPNLRADYRLSHELKHGLQELITHLGQELSHHGGSHR